MRNVRTAEDSSAAKREAEGNNRSERKFVITERSTLHSRREARENSYFISLPRLLHQWAAE